MMEKITLKFINDVEIRSPNGNLFKASKGMVKEISPADFGLGEKEEESFRKVIGALISNQGAVPGGAQYGPCTRMFEK